MDAKVTSTPFGEAEGVRRRRPRRLSQVFSDLAQQANGPISIGAIRDALGDRSFAALLVFFALPNLLPLPPGATALLGLPLVLVSAQMVYGSHRAWLPEVLSKRSVSPEAFKSLMDRIVPRLIRIEQMIRPRYWPFWRRHGDRVIGLIALVLAITITLPIPLGNWPPAFATALLGLALSERDGILFAVGSAVALGSMAIVASVIGVVTATTAAVFHAIM
jgi:hypothetical protein